ncbi:MAG: polyprenol monophosphomannose synthase [Syntrophobacterales bacterium]|jgi:dolichol-phosphate mannosyltransferase
MSNKYTTSRNAFVIIPTYNEKANIGRLIPIVLKKGPNIKVLVVDDNSPDGTGALVEEMARADDRVFLVSRSRKLGLGSAYVKGFKWVLANGDCEYIFEMDADFSHNPDRIPDFISKMDEGYDLVIGSRYLRGVSVVNWSIKRLMLSYCASMYARKITGIPVKDQTTGYKCFHRKVLETIDLDSIFSDHYAFQIEMNYRAIQKGFKLAEVPIIFEDRLQGESKISKRVIFEAIWVVWRLRLQTLLSGLNRGKKKPQRVGETPHRFDACASSKNPGADEIDSNVAKTHSQLTEGGEEEIRVHGG